MSFEDKLDAIEAMEYAFAQESGRTDNTITPTVVRKPFIEEKRALPYHMMDNITFYEAVRFEQAS